MGWARANVLYDKGPFPETGTLQEVVHMVVFQARQNADIARVRASAQAALGGDKAVEAFQAFRDLLTSPTRNKNKADMAEALKKIGEMGPISFRPLINVRHKPMPRIHREDPT